VTAPGGYILAWLKDAIRDRERTARNAASEAGGTWCEDLFVYGVRDQKNAMVARSREERASSIVHIAANDPESVLRRCAVDRKLLELHAGKMHSCPATDETGYLDEWTQFSHSEVCPVVEHLADGYGWLAGRTPPTEGDQVT
jgi:uncharacterized protein DUF6221